MIALAAKTVEAERHTELHGGPIATPRPPAAPADGPAPTLVSALLGAAAGAAGVFALDRLDWFLWNRMPEDDRARTRAARPGGEPPAEALVTVAADATGTQLSSSAHAAASQAVHYGLGIGPGIGYALLRDRLPGSGPVRGAGFGFALFLLQDEALNSVTGLGGKPGDYPRQDHARGLAAHVLYGVVTDLALTAMERGFAAVSRDGAERAP